MTNSSNNESEDTGILLVIAKYLFIPWSILILLYFGYHHWAFIKDWPNFILYCWLDLFIQKPDLSGPGFFPRFFDNIKTILILLLFLLAAYGAGYSIIGKIRNSGTGKIETGSYAITLGFGILAYTIQFLGLVHMLYSPLLCGTLTIGIRISYKSYIDLYKYLKESINVISSEKEISLNTLLISVSVFIGYLWIIGGLVPPFDYDSLHYHLAFPQIYLQNHLITFQSQNVFAQFPFIGEMLYTWGIAIGGYSLPALLHGIGSLIMAAFVYSIGNRIWGKIAGVSAVLLCLTSLHLARAAIKPQIDIFTALFSIAALCCLFRWLDRRENFWLLFGGIFTGLGLGTKYTSLVLILIPLAVGLLFSSIRENKGRSYAIKNILIFSGIALLTALPWFLRNLIWTGNPVYPLLFKIFGGQGMNADLDRMIFNYHSSPLLKDLTGFKSDSTALSSFCNNLMEFWQVPFSAFKNNVIWLSPALITFPLFGLTDRKSRKHILWLVFLIIYYYLVWFTLTHHVIRFLFPVIPLLALLGGKGISNMVNNKATYNFAIIILAIVTIFQLGSFFIMTSTSDIWTYIIGQSDKETFLSKRLPDYYPIVKYLNNNMTENDKLLQIGELRTTYQKNPGITANVFNNSPVDEMMLNAIDKFEIINRMKSAGYNYVWLNRVEYARLSKTYGYGEKWNTQLLNDTLAELGLDYSTPYGGIYRIH